MRAAVVILAQRSAVTWNSAGIVCVFGLTALILQALIGILHLFFPGLSIEINALNKVNC